MNNTISSEIRFVYNNEKYILDKDPFKSDKGYFYLPDGKLGWAESWRALNEGQIQIKNQLPLAKAKIVKAFTIRMNGFDVEFDKGFPFRIWMERLNAKDDSLCASRLTAQKLMDNCGFETRVGEFQINDSEKGIYFALCSDLRKKETTQTKSQFLDDNHHYHEDDECNCPSCDEHNPPNSRG